MKAEQIFSENFLQELAGAVDRYYDRDSGAFTAGHEIFHTAAGMAALVVVAAAEVGLPARTVGIDSWPEGSTHPEHGMGYDWAFVANRWVVDLWRWNYHNSGPLVYDLNDPHQADLVLKTFGKESDWEDFRVNADYLKAAKEVWRYFTVPHRAISALLGEG